MNIDILEHLGYLISCYKANITQSMWTPDQPFVCFH